MALPIEVSYCAFLKYTSFNFLFSVRVLVTNGLVATFAYFLYPPVGIALALSTAFLSIWTAWNVAEVYVPIVFQCSANLAAAIGERFFFWIEGIRQPYDRFLDRFLGFLYVIPLVRVNVNDRGNNQERLSDINQEGVNDNVDEHPDNDRHLPNLPADITDVLHNAVYVIRTRREFIRFANHARQQNRNDIVLPLAGMTGAGKSSTLKILVGFDGEVPVGVGINNSKHPLVGIFRENADGSRVYIIDMPGVGAANQIARAANNGAPPVFNRFIDLLMHPNISGVARGIIVVLTDRGALVLDGIHDPNTLRQLSNDHGFRYLIGLNCSPFSDERLPEKERILRELYPLADFHHVTYCAYDKPHPDLISVEPLRQAIEVFLNHNEGLLNANLIAVPLEQRIAAAAKLVVESAASAAASTSVVFEVTAEYLARAADVEAAKLVFVAADKLCSQEPITLNAAYDAFKPAYDAYISGPAYQAWEKAMLQHEGAKRTADLMKGKITSFSSYSSIGRNTALTSFAVGGCFFVYDGVQCMRGKITGDQLVQRGKSRLYNTAVDTSFGTALMPGIGTAIGSVVGGLIGNIIHSEIV